jgi:hypothetical protein
MKSGMSGGHRSGAELRALVRERDGDDCSVCLLPIDFTRPPGTAGGPSLEHVVPRAAGGKTVLANLRLAHAYPCNKAKGAVHDGVDWCTVADARQQPKAPGARHERRMAAIMATGGLYRPFPALDPRDWQPPAGARCPRRDAGQTHDWRDLGRDVRHVGGAFVECGALMCARCGKGAIRGPFDPSPPAR